MHLFIYLYIHTYLLKLNLQYLIFRKVNSDPVDQNTKNKKKDSQTKMLFILRSVISVIFIRAVLQVSRKRKKERMKNPCFYSCISLMGNFAISASVPGVPAVPVIILGSIGNVYGKKTVKSDETEYRM